MQKVEEFKEVKEFEEVKRIRKNSSSTEGADGGDALGKNDEFTALKSEPAKKKLKLQINKTKKTEKKDNDFLLHLKMEVKIE